ncbi:MAG: hypothetical protein HY922_03800 [Elusimicrobia bacterium]|nr:hypothetical protein [Elusimicrobiota bacterium]
MKTIKKKGIIACIVLAFVAWGGWNLLMWHPDMIMPVFELAAWPFSFVLARYAPQGTKGEVGMVSGSGVSRVSHPLAMGLMHVNWAKYTDEKGVKRRGPVATLSMWRDDTPRPWKATDIDVYAGQHLQWDIFSLYIEEVSYFPEFVQFRVYKSNSAKPGTRTSNTSIAQLADWDRRGNAITVWIWPIFTDDGLRPRRTYHVLGVDEKNKTVTVRDPEETSPVTLTEEEFRKLRGEVNVNPRSLSKPPF